MLQPCNRVIFLGRKEIEHNCFSRAGRAGSAGQDQDIGDYMELLARTIYIPTIVYVSSAAILVKVLGIVTSWL